MSDVSDIITDQDIQMLGQLYENIISMARERIRRLNNEQQGSYLYSKEIQYLSSLIHEIEDGTDCVFDLVAFLSTVPEKDYDDGRRKYADKTSQVIIELKRKFTSARNS